jgi:deoxyribodipyrimidine photo-lyase
MGRMPVPDLPPVRIRAVNDAPIRPERGWVLYWMIAARRTTANFALQQAAARARELGRPLLVLEALRAGYPWASARHHAFVIQGMADNAAALASRPVRYLPYVEPAHGEGAGLLETLAADAAVVVTDDFPAFFLPRMVSAAGRALDVRLEAVDGNGLLPLRATDRVFSTAFSFRAYLQRELPAHLGHLPLDDPLAGDPLPPPPPLSTAVTRRWRPAPAALLAAAPKALAALPIDQTVGVAPDRGGPVAAHAKLRGFLDQRLGRYRAERSQPEADAASGLSPYLHFGHLSVHEVFGALMTRERWTRRKLGASRGGKREGWWNTGPDAEAFLDELVTWREIGLNMCAHRDDYDRYESLPDWARATLEAHRRDRRPHRYDLEAFESAATHDPLWNAAQTQIVREGRMHNYLRMLWGKKILEWSATPREALAVMIHLNNKYGLDGRDPNSYSGIFWCLGRYDRPWGPERPIFGTVRYMSSDNTARKLKVKDYIRRYAPSAPGLFD